MLVFIPDRILKGLAKALIRLRSHIPHCWKSHALAQLASSKFVSYHHLFADDNRPVSANGESSPTKPKFGRHSSFDQICAVAEHERNKLYASASEPASPTNTPKGLYLGFILLFYCAKTMGEHIQDYS